jgi:hypothetical protein
MSKLPSRRYVFETDLLMTEKAIEFLGLKKIGDKRWRTKWVEDNSPAKYTLDIFAKDNNLTLVELSE